MPIDNHVPLVSGHKPFGSGTSGAAGLNIRGASSAEGAQVIWFPYEDQTGGSFQDNELFELRATGEKFGGADYVFIIAKNSGMAVTAPLTGNAGDQVIQAILAGAENQKWLQFSPNGGNGLIFKNKRSGLVLDASLRGPSGNDHGFLPIIVFPENDGDNQLWFFSSEADQGTA